MQNPADDSLSAQPLLPGLPLELLADPLEFIYADHLRQRSACNLVEGLLLNPEADPRAIPGLLEFFTRDLALHMLDEEQDLFPLLRRRALKEDDIGALLGQLAAEHAQDEQLLPSVLAVLREMLEGTPPNRRSKRCKDALSFVVSERRHLALENAALLPIARLRLKARDREALGRRMAARRGLDYPG